MIYMLWKECMPQKFYKHICKEKNFHYLNGKNVLQPKVLEIIKQFLDEDQSHYEELRYETTKANFSTFIPTFSQKISARLKKRGFDMNSNFHIILKNKKQLQSFLGKNPENYKNVCKETNIYEQKSGTIDEFNKVVEKEVQKHVEKRREKRREIAEQNKLLIKNKKEKNKRKQK